MSLLTRYTRAMISASTRPILSIVVVLFNMRREAKRSLLALSAAYQEGVRESDYEVHVVENGSADPVGESFVRQFGSNFHYHLLQESRPSPAYALNYGVAKSRGKMIGLMIDGAHILTPRVVQYTLRVRRAYECPVIAVRRMYLGPGQQPNTMQQGYNQDVEDSLLSEIRWPEQPYRLFEIGVFMGNTRPGWFGGFWESNCLIMPRRVFDGMGGCDERFNMPAGGFLNLDLLRRAVEHQGSQSVVLLGEGSFHQCHGGTTTNAAPAVADERNARFRAQYAEIRDQEYRAPEVPLEFFGALQPQNFLV